MERNTSTTKVTHNTQGSDDPQSVKPKSAISESLTQPELMERARNQATFDSSKLTELILGGKEAVNRQNEAFKRIEKALGIDDLSKLPRRYGNMNREDMLLEGLRASRITVGDGIDNCHDLFFKSNHEWAMGNSSPLALTQLLFAPMIRLQGTPEQIAYWTPLAESGSIIGSYSQTELGHGTFVAGIETTATFDKETDEFIIHTPSLSATKYWPGALGFASTHTIVIARLIIDRKDYGIHSFIMQIRSLSDFTPLPGIDLGDIGLKMSYNGTDNGYAVFHHVRIPRTALLSRYASVSPSGVYTSYPLHAKLLYGGMLNGRSLIIRNCAFQLAQAVTIAIRYSTVRTQGQRSLHGEEPAVMGYKLQHYRLLILTSKAYASIFASSAVDKIYKTLLAQQAQGEHDMLPYVHMLMSGIKAWTTQTAADGAEDARKACGGHGYLVISGLPEIVNSVTACCTFEGENYVLWKQVSRYIIKGLSASTLPEDMEYMGPYYYCGPTTCTYHDEQFLEPENLVRVFEYRAARLSHEVFEALRKEDGGKVRAEERHAVALLGAARAHIELYILRSFLSSLPPPSPIHTVLTNLLLLFALTTISSPLSASSSFFLEDAYFSRSQIATMREQTDGLLEKLLPDAVALTDAWSFTDASLSSALGCRDGDVYRRIMEWTRQLPINVEAANNGGVLREGWENSIRPFLREGELRVRSML